MRNDGRWDVSYFLDCFVVVYSQHAFECKVLTIDSVDIEFIPFADLVPCIDGIERTTSRFSGTQKFWNH